MEFEIQPLIFAGLGVAAFFWGFTRWRKKRLIENIPTSTIRALAMGLVELVGEVKKIAELRTPFSAVECVFYRYKVERYQRRERSSKWVTMAKGDSSFIPFYLEDKTGKVLVSAKGAEVILPLDYEFISGLGHAPTPQMIDFLERNNLAYRGLLGQQKLRFREWFIYPGETVYALGTAKKSSDFIQGYKQKLIIRLEELKRNPQKKKEMDTNKDGEISLEEWDAAKKKIEEELLEEELKSGQSEELADVMIAKGEEDKVFIISDHSQKDLLKTLFGQALLGIYGGAVLTLVMLAVFLYKLSF